MTWQNEKKIFSKCLIWPPLSLVLGKWVWKTLDRPQYCKKNKSTNTKNIRKLKICLKLSFLNWFSLFWRIKSWKEIAIFITLKLIVGWCLSDGNQDPGIPLPHFNIQWCDGVDVPSFRPFLQIILTWISPSGGLLTAAASIVMPDDEASTQCNPANWIVV